MQLIPRNLFFDDIFDDLDRPMLPVEADMKCDIYEKDGDYHIEVDIPGFKKEDISVTCDNGYLTISAVKNSEDEDKSKKYIRRERHYGKYQRSFYLGDIDSNKIKASFKHGILNIVVPKVNEVETKKNIEIEG